MRPYLVTQVPHSWSQACLALSKESRSSKSKEDRGSAPCWKQKRHDNKTQCNFCTDSLCQKRYYWDKWQNLKKGWENDGCNASVINSYFLSLYFSHIGKHSCIGNTYYSICMWWQFSVKWFREKWSSLYNTFNISVNVKSLKKTLNFNVNRL